MKLTSDSFREGAVIPPRYALGRRDEQAHVALSDNRNPHLAWSDLPAGTRSLVLICHDTDAPTRPDDVNKEGRSVPAALPRADFTHWVLVDLPPDSGPIVEGEFSSAVTPHGKAAAKGPRGTRQGLNDYTGWFAGDKDMAGDYLGYDGPCPPWNDERVHHYHFTLYALGVPACPAQGVLTRAAVLSAIEPHVLGKAVLVGTYALNPRLG